MALLIAPNRRRSSNPAQLSIAGAVSNGATWIETLTMVDNEGAQLTGVGSDTWQIQIRDNPEWGTSPVVTLATGTELTITVGATTTLAIDCPQDTIANLEGDYIVDIVSKTSGGDITHRAHGMVTFQSSPVAF